MNRSDSFEFEPLEDNKLQYRQSSQEFDDPFQQLASSQPSGNAEPQLPQYQRENSYECEDIFSQQLGNQQSPSFQQQIQYKQQNSYGSFDDIPAQPREINFNYADDEPIIPQQPNTITTENKEIEKPKDIKLEDIVKLSLRTKRTTLQASPFHTQQFPILATLDVENVQSSQRAPIDLICVIDHSGSMAGEKIKLVRDSFGSLLNYLRDTDRLSIIIFDDNAQRLTPLICATEANKDRILIEIASVKDAGGTDINYGMQHAFEIIKQRRCKNPVTSIFLLSDGLDGGAEHKVKQSLLEANIPEDVIIHTFGFGNDHDPKLMGGISDLRGGNFYFVKQLDTVDEAFVDCLGGLLSSVGQNVQIKILPTQSEVLEGVKIVKAYGHGDMWAQSDQAYITKITNLISGRQKNYVLELSLPATNKIITDNQKQVVVAKAEVEITGLNGQKVTKTADLQITLLNPDEQLQPEEDDRDVMKNFYRVKGASVIGDAKELANAGEYEQAQKLLENFKEEIENSALKTEEFIQNLIKDIERTIQNIQPAVYQDYGKCEMEEDYRAQMCEMANFKSANCYRNEVQSDMLNEVRRSKAK